MAVGFPPKYMYNAVARPPAEYAPKPDYRPTGEWDLYVFDGCKAAKRGHAPEVPTPAFWLNRLKSLYGVDDYNMLTGDSWNVDAYTLPAWGLPTSTPSGPEVWLQSSLFGCLGHVWGCGPF